MNKELATTLLASEIIDCNPKNNGREGVICAVNGEKLWVDWFGRRTWVLFSRCHTNQHKKSGYYVPALKERREDEEE